MSVLTLKIILGVLIIMNIIFFTGMILWMLHPEGFVEHDGTEPSKIVFNDEAYYKALSNKKGVILMRFKKSNDVSIDIPKSEP